jgi:addiction module HigA family antidote
MHPKNPIHPGEFLLDEFLLPMGVSQPTFAAALGWPPKRLNELVTGKRSITTDSALQLGNALGTSMVFWMYLHVSWVLHIAAHRKRAPVPIRIAEPRRMLPPPRRRTRERPCPTLPGIGAQR